MKILVIDNHDSFVYNAVGLIARNGISLSDICVIKSDHIPFSDVTRYNAAIISPGPGLPEESGDLMRFVAECVPHIPTLGICLGLQAIAKHFGIALEQCNHPRHGHASSIKITDPKDELLKNLRNGTTVGRYHSWRITTPTEFSPIKVTSIATDDDTVMSVRHKNLPIHGVQFHPESIITEEGDRIIRNFLTIIRKHKI